MDEAAYLRLGAGAVRQFATTHWGVVLAARDKNDSHASDALEALCRTYWYPIYAYVRRRGYDADDAQDLTQEFFTRLLAKEGLSNVTQAKGKFRSFLLASVNHLLADERDRSRRQKRGGGQIVLSFDTQSAEGRYQLELADPWTPEKLFERRWALALVEHVLHRLHQEYSQNGKAELFSVLKDSLTGGKAELDYPSAARRLAMTEGAVRTAVYRLRQRFGEQFRLAVAETLTDPNDLDAEMRHVLAALSD